MASRKQQVVIFLLLGTILLSAVGTIIAVVLGGKQEDSQAQQLDEAKQMIDKLNSCKASDADLKAGAKAKVPEQPFVIKESVTKLTLKDLKVGQGQGSAETDCVVVNYQGWIAKTGKIFDSSYERGQPIAISLDSVIGGWRAGVPGMKVGGIRRLVIPANLAYGSTGSPPKIGPDAALVFDVELVAVKR